MNKSKYDKLDNLVKKLSIYKICNQNFSADDFIVAERRLSIKIPEDYKYFYQILGSGRLGDFVDIFCVDNGRITESKATAEYMIDKINGIIWDEPPRKVDYTFYGLEYGYEFSSENVG